MPTNEYWEGRFAQLEQRSHDHAARILRQLEQAYKAAQAEIERKTLHWYQRFADNNGMTMAQAKIRLNDPQLKELKWTVQEYIKAGREMALDGRWIKELENASARFHITRFEALRLQNQQTIEALFGNQRDAMESLLKHTYLDRYYHSAFELQKGFGVGWDIAMIDEAALARIISRPWATDGKNFSARIWGSKQRLIGELQKQMTQNLLTGKAPDASIDAIAREFGVSRNQAGRLVMTESAYFASLSQQGAFNALGVKRYQVVATLDDRTSEICQQMDGQVFEMKDFQAGVSAPPFHPWCRSVTAPYFDDMRGVGERAARGEDGQVYYVPREMKYDEWYNTFVTNVASQATPGQGTGGIINTLQQASVGDFVSLAPNALTVKQQGDYAQILFDRYQQGTQDAKEVYDKYIPTGGCVADGRSQGKAAYYPNQNNIRMNFANDLTNSREPGTTWFHEHGHYVDYNAGHVSLDAEYRRLLRKDFRDHVNRVKAQYGYTNDRDAFFAISTELHRQPDTINAVSDLFGGMSKNKAAGAWQHKAGYWKGDALTNEAFAHMFEASFSSGKAAHMRTFFPKAWTKFQAILKGLK